MIFFPSEKSPLVLPIQSVIIMVNVFGDMVNAAQDAPQSTDTKIQQGLDATILPKF